MQSNVRLKSLNRTKKRKIRLIKILGSKLLARELFATPVLKKFEVQVALVKAQIIVKLKKKAQSKIIYISTLGLYHRRCQQSNHRLR